MLSFTLSRKHMSYAYTHLKHKTITDIRIFMHSYKNLYNYLCLYKPILIWISHQSYRAYYPYLLQSLYWYFLSYTYSELTLIADLYLSPVGHILTLISRRTHTYIDFLVCETKLIHILIRRYLSTYSYLYFL